MVHNSLRPWFPSPPLYCQIHSPLPLVLMTLSRAILHCPIKGFTLWIEGHGMTNIFFIIFHKRYSNGREGKRETGGCLKRKEWAMLTVFYQRLNSNAMQTDTHDIWVNDVTFLEATFKHRGPYGNSILEALPQWIPESYLVLSLLVLQKEQRISSISIPCGQHGIDWRDR